MNSLEAYRKKPTKLTPDSMGEEIFIALPIRAQELMCRLQCGSSISELDEAYIRELEISKEQISKLFKYFEDQRVLTDFID